MRCLLGCATCLLIILILPAASDAAGRHRGRATGGAAMENPTPAADTRITPGRIVIKLLPGVGVETLGPAPAGLTVGSLAPMFPQEMTRKNTTSVDIGCFYLLRYSGPVDPREAAREIALLPGVDFAEPSYEYPVTREPDYSPNDPLFSTQYGLTRILAPQAWDITRGDSTVVIGIVDSGVEVEHPDLSANIWRNAGETGFDGLGRDRRTNGEDDDANGYIDDWRGWDFAGANYAVLVPDNNPSPTATNNAHGTHVAGIAAASTDNGLGVAGTAFRCRILAIKTAADNDTRGPGGVGYILAGYEGIAYAAFMGADIVNCSWGGSGGSQTEQQLITYATELGTLVVAAAGNNASSQPFYPASYENVLSVAATNQSDVRASFSNYGLTVDVCAPGVSINSTLFPGTYTSSYSGTSMASPFAAGAAALVRTVFPALSARQIAERVRVTADNIDGVNPSYAGLLGKGRINIQRALTLSSPALRARDLAVLDSAGGNNNGVPEPGETIDLVMTFVNYLDPASSASATLTTTASGLTVSTGTILLGALGTLDTLRNRATPFRIQVGTTVTPGLVATLKVTVTDGPYTDLQYFTVVINPTYQTHAVNQVGVTMTSNGRIGFNNFSTNTQGVGFTYPLGGNNHLFEGGLILGTSATRLVNNVRNTGGGQDGDFLARVPYRLQTPGVVSNQDGWTVFSDSAAPDANRLGVSVEQYSYAYADPDHDDYVIVRYDIRNLTGAPIAGMFVGQFFDWDIAAYGTNRTGFDSARSLAYAWDQGTPAAPYTGVRALDGAAGARGLVNVSLAVDRAAKWGWISGGDSLAAAGPQDIHSVISSGPFTVAPGGTVRCGFALIGGMHLSALQTNADFARQKWEEILLLVSAPPDPAPLPASFALEQNYPNPFNGETTIRYRVGGADEIPAVTLTVYDLLGRVAAVLHEGRRAPGEYAVRFDGSSLASGVYLYRLEGAGLLLTRKMMLLR